MNEQDRPNLKQQICDAIERIKVERTTGQQSPVRITGLSEEPIELSDAEAQALAQLLIETDAEYAYHCRQVQPPLPYWLFKSQKRKLDHLLAQPIPGPLDTPEQRDATDEQIQRFDQLRRSLGC